MRRRASLFASIALAVAGCSLALPWDDLAPQGGIVDASVREDVPVSDSASSFAPDAESPSDAGTDAGIAIFQDDFERSNALGAWQAVDLRGGSNVRILRPGALGASVLNTTTPRSAGTVAAALKSTRTRPVALKHLVFTFDFMVRALDPMTGAESADIFRLGYGHSRQQAIVIGIQSGNLALHRDAPVGADGGVAIRGPALAIQKAYRATLMFDGIVGHVELLLDGVTVISSADWVPIEGDTVSLQLGLLEAADPTFAASVDFDNFSAFTY